mmetsp:Transcript_59977/g.104967  ORF Transcript_59977/g.104967 Transcript_59977/m.104967 type:complete len:134 (-) Transcript_59977:94-495(-)
MGWLPDWKWKEQQAQKKGGAKGGGGWQPKWQPKWGGGKSTGGKGGWKKKRGNDPSKTIWIGGLPDGATFKDLMEHGAQAGTAKWAEIYKNKGKGTGAIGYATAEEAATAVGLLNGSIFAGSQIQADSWEKMTK